MCVGQLAMFSVMCIPREGKQENLLSTLTYDCKITLIHFYSFATSVKVDHGIMLFHFFLIKDQYYIHYIGYKKLSTLKFELKFVMNCFWTSELHDVSIITDIP